MPCCLLAAVSLLLPRVTMFFIWALTDLFTQAFDTWLWPVLGFIFMPYTTLAYLAAMVLNNHQLTGGWIVLVVVAVLIDFGSLGGSASSRRRN